MSTTTTIRVDHETHRRLLAISRASGRSLMDVARAAAEALERQRFAALVSSQLELLRADTASWSAYTDEAEPALRDGLA